MRRVHVLPLFGLCAAALLGVMAWLTVTLRRLDEAERRGREQSTLEESVRLALWRMESLVGPLVARESLRWPLPPGTGPAPPSAASHVRLVALWGGRGDLTAWSPSAGRAEAAAQAARLAPREALLAGLPEEWLPTDLGTLEPPPSVPRPASKVGPPRKLLVTPVEQQQALNEGEFQARASNVAVLSGTAQLAAPAGPVRPVRLGRLAPLWVDGELLLGRRVQVGAELRVQVCWLDWPALRATLLEAVQDLLPEARLEPAAEGDDPSRRLAALPIRLEPGPTAAAVLAPEGQGRLSLAAAWGLAALALGATGALLYALAALGERRAAFVSAVTHELRTPLTTFRLYADMLAEGMVPPERQAEYLETLRREAERQAHLVENVLAYSRLERGRHRATREVLPVDALISDLRGALSDQASRAGLELVGPVPGPAGPIGVLADRPAVERILSNLVDNAGKYARDASDRRLHLDVEVEPRAVSLLVSDHGPGVPRAEVRRLFRPFHKSAGEAARSAPGVGLGLALSRRLARAAGGDLSVEASEGGGARFRLRLPRA